MTTTLLPGLLETGGRNAGRGQPDVALFETATVTKPRGSQPAPILPVDRRPTPGEWDDLQKALPDQPLHLALLVCGERERSGWWGPGRQASWSDAVQTVREVAQALGVQVQVRPASLAPWHPGRCAEVLVGEETIGHAGELHPKVCQAFGLPPRAAAAEVDLDRLLQHATPAKAPVLSTYPVAKIDLAFVVAEEVPAEDLRQTLVEGAGGLLESVRLFDVYTGEQIGAGRRSLAFALRLRAPDRTLTDEEVAAVRADVIALAQERHGAVLR
jgi:phenylalanyl-tRNA synthetase beta chain